MGCQVFISYNRANDKGLADGLAGDLRGAGAEVFCHGADLSDENAQADIYRALDEAKLLIVVGSKREHMEENFTSKEWFKFIHTLVSGKKKDGKLFVFYDGMKPEEIPLALTEYPSFNGGQRGDLISQVKKALGIPEKPVIPPETNSGGFLFILLLALLLVIVYALLSPDSPSSLEQRWGEFFPFPPSSASSSADDVSPTDFFA